MDIPHRLTHFPITSNPAASRFDVSFPLRMISTMNHFALCARFPEASEIGPGEAVRVSRYHSLIPGGFRRHVSDASRGLVARGGELGMLACREQSHRPWREILTFSGISSFVCRCPGLPEAGQLVTKSSRAQLAGLLLPIPQLS